MSWDMVRRDPKTAVKPSLELHIAEYWPWLKRYSDRSGPGPHHRGLDPFSVCSNGVEVYNCLIGIELRYGIPCGGTLCAHSGEIAGVVLKADHLRRMDEIVTSD